MRCLTWDSKGPQALAPTRAWMVLALWAVVGCSSADEGPVPVAADDSDALVEESVVGPVKAVVRVTPRAPVLGDPVRVTLQVEAEAGVEVFMPAFGDQLGRFGIAEYAPTHAVGSDGGSVHVQRYTLEVPMSGRQRIPSFLVEFSDRRDDRAAEVQELLTEEVVLEVASVLPADVVSPGLKPPRDALPELPARERQVSWAQSGWLWGGMGFLVLGLVGAAVWWRRRRRVAQQRSAFEIAWEALLALEAEPLPRGEEVDAWYVRLSGIVRAFIEGRYGLRAPKLTTEEFLLLAGRSEVLKVQHRATLAALLERADRVKFTAYQPAAEESAEALASARRFLEESREEETREEVSVARAA